MGEGGERRVGGVNNSLEIIDWIIQNKEWLFSGVGVIVVGAVFNKFFRKNTPSLNMNETTKYNALLIEYIDTILNNFCEASKELPLVGVSSSERWLWLIRNAVIDDKWNEYIEKSSLSASESVQLKKWFKMVMDAISITHNQSYDIQILEGKLKVIIYDSNIGKIRSKLE